MSWFHRREKEAPTVNVTVVNDGKERPIEPDPGAATANEREQMEEAAATAIKTATSIRARVGKLFADFGWVMILFAVIGIAIDPSEWWIAIASAVVANLAMYGYTKWVYHPPVIPVVQYDDDGTGGVLRAWAIPIGIWNAIAKTGLSNTIQTSYGVTYMVRAIRFADDEGTIPVAVEFSWLHYNELNFATKRQMFDELRNALRIAWEQNNRYKWLMEVITLRRALAMTKRWISLISHGRYAPVSAQDEARLNSEIEQLAQEGRGLRMPGAEESRQVLASAEDEGSAPL